MKVLNIGLAMALVASIGLNVALRTGTISRPPLEYFPDMARTVRYNAFEPNPNFTDGMTLRVPPPGTIARGMLPPASDPATPPGGTPLNPFKPEDTAAVARGKVVFDTYCVPCHGPSGEGDGVVVERGFPGPPSLISGRAPTMTDSQLFDVIAYGSGAMLPYGAQVAPEDRWKAILHLRTLQNQPAPAGEAK
jgi:mono/diheme cytochrome c family protein